MTVTLILMKSQQRIVTRFLFCKAFSCIITSIFSTKKKRKEYASAFTCLFFPPKIYEDSIVMQSVFTNARECLEHTGQLPNQAESESEDDSQEDKNSETDCKLCNPAILK